MQYTRFMKTKYVYYFYVVLFLILAKTALNFNYVEGDDASTILYHALGRNSDLQPVYSPYHSMFDAVMALVPTQNETTLRMLGVTVSFLSGCFVLLFLAVLLTNYFKAQKAKIAVFLLTLPFVVPDILFNSLLINPANISFALLLLSHIFLNRFMGTKRYLFLVLSVLIFGFGVGFRWNNGFYLFVLFGAYVLDMNQENPTLKLWHRLKKSVLIFPWYVVSVVVFIQISGYSVYDIIDVYKFGTSYIAESDISLLAMAASSISFLTPAFVILFILGIIHCVKNKIYLPLFLFCFALLPYMLLGIYPYYKYMICLLLPIILIQAYGYLGIERKSVQSVLAAIIFLPWIFGLQVQSTSAWGPGFEVKTKDLATANVDSFNPDKATTINDVQLKFGAGMAMPTPEGPRPLFGFGAVFLKRWYSFIDSNNFEREAVVKYALENKCNILQDVDHAFIISKLSEKAFQTKPSYNTAGNLNLRRPFYNDKDSIYVDVFKNKKQLFNSEIMAQYLNEDNCVVVYASYTNIITKLKTQYPNRFELRGAYWGIFNK